MHPNLLVLPHSARKKKLQEKKRKPKKGCYSRSMEDHRSGSNITRNGIEGLSIYYPRFLCCSD